MKMLKLQAFQEPQLYGRDVTAIIYVMFSQSHTDSKIKASFKMRVGFGNTINFCLSCSLATGVVIVKRDLQLLSNDFKLVCIL